MITLEQFEVQFNKLQAAFGTVKSAKIFEEWYKEFEYEDYSCLLYTSPSPRDRQKSRMPSSA